MHALPYDQRMQHRPFTIPTRRTLRRAYRGECHAVSLDRYSVIGEEVLDLSPRGMLLAADNEEATLGETLAIRVNLPFGGELNLEGRVARIVHGRRDTDRRTGLGVEFTRLPMAARHELLVQLAGTPPPVPARSLRVGYGPLAIRAARGPGVPGMR